MKAKLKVLLVDDHLVVRMGLSTLIGLEKDISVVGTAGNGKEALRLVRQHRPDVVIMDLMMPEMGGAEATARIMKEFPSSRILLLTTFGDSDDLRSAMEAGAISTIVKDASHDELISAIRETAAGRQVISPEIRQAISGSESTPELNRRQIDILTYAAKGMITNAIAEKLGIGPDCVKAHLRTAFAKLGASSRSEAVARALQKGLLRI